MFDEYVTLADLNAARIRAVRDGCDIVEVNNAYNQRRAVIIGMRKAIKPIIFVQTPAGQEQKYTYLNVLGNSDRPDLIKVLPDGIYI